MSKFQEIKNKQLMARKEKKEITSSLLTTLIGEISMIAKNDGNREVNDVDVGVVIKKFLKGIEENIVILTKRGDDVTKFQLEKEILMEFMPKQLNEEELKTIISDLIKELKLVDIKGLGLIMKNMKVKYENQYDSNMVSRIVKELLG